MSDTNHAPAPAPAPPPAPPPAAWHSGIDGELLGHIQTLGWDKKTAPEVAVEAARAHREARAFIGIPESRLIKLPADPVKESDAMRAVFQRLGAPADAKDYDFSTVKRTDGTAIEQPLADMIRKTAFDASLPKDAATRVAQSVAKFMDDQKAESLAVQTAKWQAESADLKKNWGPNFDANLFVAKNAALKLGINPVAVDTLEKIDGVGKAVVLDMFHKLGVKMGEDKYVAGQNPGNNGVMSQEQAKAELAALKADKAFGARLLAGGAAEKRQWEALHLMLYGEQAA